LPTVNAGGLPETWKEAAPEVTTPGGGAPPDEGHPEGPSDLSLLPVSDVREVVENCVARYLHRHPNGNPCEHLVDLCPVLGAVSPRRQFVVTSRRRVLYYRANGFLRLDLREGLALPQLPEFEPVRRCLESGKPQQERVTPSPGARELLVTALPVKGLEGRLQGSLAIFEEFERDRLEDSASHARLVKKLSALHQFNASLELMADPVDLYERAVDAASTILGYEYCAILLHEPEKRRLVLQHSVGYAPELHQLAIPLDGRKGITANAFLENRIVSVKDVRQDPRYLEAHREIRSELAIPIVAGGRPVGVFSAASSQPGAFSEEDTKLCSTLVSQLGLATERLNLFQKVADSRDVLVFALARLAESRDDDTGGHLERICGYTRVIAQALRSHPRFQHLLDDAYLDDLYRSAALHDIGKVGIPDAILQKKGRLTREEFEIMKTHTVIGGDTLKRAERRIENLGLLKIGTEIAYHHHEKWDGQGYPFGLSGEDIPIPARIVGLADVYDALTSKRCYKEAYSHEVAREYILKSSGRHFDPGVVRAFLDSERQILEIRRRHSG